MVAAVDEILVPLDRRPRQGVDPYATVGAGTDNPKPGTVRGWAMAQANRRLSRCKVSRGPRPAPGPADAGLARGGRDIRAPPPLRGDPHRTDGLGRGSYGHHRSPGGWLSAWRRQASQRRRRPQPAPGTSGVSVIVDFGSSANRLRRRRSRSTPGPRLKRPGSCARSAPALPGEFICRVARPSRPRSGGLRPDPAVERLLGAVVGPAWRIVDLRQLRSRLARPRARHGDRAGLRRRACPGMAPPATAPRRRPSPRPRRPHPPRIPGPPGRRPRRPRRHRHRPQHRPRPRRPGRGRSSSTSGTVTTSSTSGAASARPLVGRRLGGATQRGRGDRGDNGGTFGGGDDRRGGRGSAYCSFSGEHRSATTGSSHAGVIRHHPAAWWLWAHPRRHRRADDQSGTAGGHHRGAGRCCAGAPRRVAVGRAFPAVCRSGRRHRRHPAGAAFSRAEVPGRSRPAAPSFHLPSWAAGIELLGTVRLEGALGAALEGRAWDDDPGDRGSQCAGLAQAPAQGLPGCAARDRCRARGCRDGCPAPDRVSCARVERACCAGDDARRLKAFRAPGDAGGSPGHPRPVAGAGGRYGRPWLRPAKHRRGAG